MSTQLLLICHDEIGNAMCQTAQMLLNQQLPLPTTIIEIQPDTDPDILISELSNQLSRLPTNDEILILTDLFGSTPYRIAKGLNHLNQFTRMVTGLNLPMLMKVFNYSDLNVNELAEKAHSAGQAGIIIAEENPD